MNKLILQGGGHPLTIEDLQFMQDAWRAGFTAAMSMFASPAYPSFIVSGCEKTAAATPGYADISAGYVYHANEVWQVEQALNVPNADIHLAPDVSYQAPSPVTYASGSDFDTKQVRKMVVGNGAPPTGGVLYATLPVLWQLLQKKGTDWQEPLYQLGVSGLSGNLQPGWRITAAGMVVFRGRVSINMATILPGAIQHNIALLPEWAAPARPRTFTATTSNGKFLRIVVSQQSGFCNIAIATTSGSSFTDSGFAGEAVNVPLDSIFHILNE